MAVRVDTVIRFREADVMAALKAVTVGTKDGVTEDVVRLALFYLDDKFAERPSWLLTREPLPRHDRPLRRANED